MERAIKVGPIAQLAEHPADNGEVSRSSRLRPTNDGWLKAELAVILSGTLRGCSSVGRASVLHAEGQRFESAHLHQLKVVCFSYSLVML